MFLDLLLEVWYVWRNFYFNKLCKFDAYKSGRGTESESFLCSASTDLRFSMALCDQEKLFMQARKDRVMLSIKKLLKMENPRFLPASPREVKSKTLNNCLINSAILKKSVLSPATSILSDSSSIFGQVPTIAILGSGGGFRAMVGFSGVMKALYESGVLDCASYVAGLSGSTWSVIVECLFFSLKQMLKSNGLLQS